MNLTEFWGLIERAWSMEPELLEQRKKAIASNKESQLEKLANIIEDELVDPYEELLYALDRDELSSFIRTWEERMYHIDRKEIQQHTDGSDDGFLYVRCFIIAMGQTYYDSIDTNPALAKEGLEAEGFGFTAYSVYQDKFDEDFKRGSKHAIETGSNKEGWAS